MEGLCKTNKQTKTFLKQIIVFIFLKKMACCYSQIKENNDNNQDIPRHGPGLLSSSSAHPPVGPRSQKCQAFYIAPLSWSNLQGLALLEFFRIDQGSSTFRPSHRLSRQDRGPHHTFSQAPMESSHRLTTSLAPRGTQGLFAEKGLVGWSASMMDKQQLYLTITLSKSEGKQNLPLYRKQRTN